MDIGKASVTHDDDVVARLGGPSNRMNKRVDFVMCLHTCTERSQHLPGIPAKGLLALALPVAENQIRLCKRRREAGSHGAELHCV